MAKSLPKGFSVTPTPTGSIARLYSTNIATCNAENRLITLDSGTWRTKHTKKCLNLVLNKLSLHCYQENFEWYVKCLKSGKVVKFFDGMQVSY